MPEGNNEGQGSGMKGRVGKGEERCCQAGGIGDLTHLRLIHDASTMMAAPSYNVTAIIIVLESSVLL